MRKKLTPKTVTCHLQTIRLFFDFLIDEGMKMINPVARISIRLPKPLPRHLKDRDVERLLSIVTGRRDKAMFMVMLRCGLRVEEVSRLTMNALELKRNRLFIAHGKGDKDRVVYISKDAKSAIEAYLAIRPKAKGLFLVEKGPRTGTPISVRGIQKRIEYYARVSGVDVSCHSLRHTFATELLNADADISTIQDLLGHTHITTTQRYCRVSNLKVQRDYYSAIERVLEKSQRDERSGVRIGEDDEEMCHFLRDRRG